jgi:hypothetical protein
MLRGVLCGFVFAGCLGSLAVAASAQEVVHALTGTVSSIDNLSKTLIVFHDTGTEGQFKDMTDSKTRVVLDKKIVLDTSGTDASKKKGTYVIVFYVGGGDERAAVALKSLGDGPFTSMLGTVTKFEGKGHAISIADSSGATQTFNLTEQTIAEGYMGVTNGFKFQVQKGDRVRVVGTAGNGSTTALFVRAM